MNLLQRSSKISKKVRNKMQYWTYIHSVDGDLLEDLGETNDLSLAIEEACNGLKLYQADDGVTARVVDNTIQGGTTVWLAGPVVRI